LRDLRLEAFTWPVRLALDGCQIGAVRSSAVSQYNEETGKRVVGQPAGEVCRLRRSITID